MMMIHKKISIMILNLIDILFFDVHAGDHVDEKAWNNMFIAEA